MAMKMVNNRLVVPEDIFEVYTEYMSPWEMAIDKSVLWNGLAQDILPRFIVSQLW